MHTVFRAGRLLAVAFVTYLAAGCGTALQDRSPPRSAGDAVEAPSDTRLAGVQLRVGRAALDQGNLRTARDLFEKAHKTAPSDAGPLVGKGDVLFAQREFDAAAGAYREALVLDDGLFEAREGLGKALVSIHQYQNGLREFEAALVLRRDSSLLNKIGVTHEMLGHGDIAQKYYRESLALQADSLTARNNLALSLGVSGSYETALIEMERVVASPRASDRHHANLAFIYGLSGRPMAEVPAKIARAAASKGWNEEFFARTREIAKSGDRTAILDLLNNRPPRAARLPAMAALPEMPDVPDMPDVPETKPKSAENSDVAPVVASLPAEAPVPAPPPAPLQAFNQVAVIVPPPAPAPDAAVNQVAVIVPPPPPAPAEVAEPVLAMAELPAADRPEQATEQITEQAGETPAEARVELAMRTPPQAPVDALDNAETAVVAAAAPVASGGAFRVQLGAFKTTRWLSATLARLSATAGDLLPTKRLNVAQQKDMYLVRSYGLPNRDAARQLCDELRALDFECFVSRKADNPSGQAFDVALAGDDEAVRRFVAGLPETELALAAPTAVAGPRPEVQTGETVIGVVPPPPAAPSDSVALLLPGGSGAVNSPDLPVISDTARSDTARKVPESGEYRIQLAAYRLARHLERGIVVLRKAVGDLLPPLESLTRAEAGQFTSIPFRLRSAPLESRTAAQELCGKLRDKGVECLVIRHGAQYWRPLA